MRIANTVNDSIVDGKGLRYAVFTQGCPHHCPGCHNPQTHDPAGGRDADTDDLAETMDGDPLLSGITLSGGEPFEQPEACLELARAAHERGLDVWAYSGYTYEALAADAGKRALLAECDVLVDGPFILAQRSLEVPWRGSRNQRLIDVPESLRQGRAVLWQSQSKVR